MCPVCLLEQPRAIACIKRKNTAIHEGKQICIDDVHHLCMSDRLTSGTMWCREKYVFASTRERRTYS
jgi:hypothetical protein